MNISDVQLYLHFFNAWVISILIPFTEERETSLSLVGTAYSSLSWKERFEEWSEGWWKRDVLRGFKNWSKKCKNLLIYWKFIKKSLKFVHKTANFFLKKYEKFKKNLKKLTKFYKNLPKIDKILQKFVKIIIISKYF